MSHGMSHRNSICIEKYKLILLYTSKSASSSIRRLGIKLLGVTWDKGVWHYSPPSPDGGKNYNDYFKVAFVRNPYARLVSYYKSIIPRFKKEWECVADLRRGMSFAEFVMELFKIRNSHSDPHYRTQSFSLQNCPIDYVIKVERFEKGWEYVTEKLDLPEIDIPHENTTKGKDYTEYYNASLQKKVYERYKEDFEQFDYKEKLC